MVEANDRYRPLPLDRHVTPRHRHPSGAAVTAGRSLLPASAVGDLDRLLLDVEAQGLLGLDVAAGHPDEERIVPVLDGMNVAHGERDGMAGLVQELALELQLGVSRSAAVVEPAPRVVVVPEDFPALSRPWTSRWTSGCRGCIGRSWRHRRITSISRLSWKEAIRPPGN